MCFVHITIFFYIFFVELWIWLSVKFEIYDGTKKQLACEKSDKLKFFSLLSLFCHNVSDVIRNEVVSLTETIYKNSARSNFYPTNYAEQIPSSQLIIGNKQFNDTRPKTITIWCCGYKYRSSWYQNPRINNKLKGIWNWKFEKCLIKSTASFNKWWKSSPNPYYKGLRELSRNYSKFKNKKVKIFKMNGGRMENFVLVS